MRALEGAAYLLIFSWYSRRKCKVGENAILGLSRAEMVRNIVSITYASPMQILNGDSTAFRQQRQR